MDSLKNAIFVRVEDLAKVQRVLVSFQDECRSGSASLSVWSPENKSLGSARLEHFQDSALHLRPSAKLIENAKLLIPRAGGGAEKSARVLGTFVTQSEKYCVQMVFEKLPSLSGLWMVSIPNGLFRVQRRANFRVQLGERIAFLETKLGEYPIRDLSAGGVRIEVPQDCDVSSFKPPNAFRMHVVGEVFDPVSVELRREGPAGEGVKSLGLKFIDLKPNIEDRLLQLAFRLEREQIKRA